MSEALKILVVDDDRDFGENVRDILEMKDYQVTNAYGGREALELVRRHDFDLVLVDIRMPVMDGLEVYKKIKEISPDTPVIMITAYAAEDLIRETLREGAFGCLRKPLDFDKLLELIENAVSNGMRVLVVDDDEDFCSNMKDVLSDKGYRVCIAYDGNTAIKKAGQKDFDVVFLDMKLPCLNGLETYLVIRDIRPKVVVVVITGYIKEMGDLVQQTLEKNAYALLEKPIDMDRLISLLREIQEERARGE